jgi:V/A-type H+-transporting ATPase subunit F
VFEFRICFEFRYSDFGFRENMEGKIAVLGDTDFVMPFSALGMDTYPADQAQQVTEAAKKIVDDKYALVIVSEDKLKAAEEVFEAYKDLPTPCIVAVPFTTESKGLATEALGQVLKMATGINILQK